MGTKERKDAGGAGTMRTERLFAGRAGSEARRVCRSRLTRRKKRERDGRLFASQEARRKVAKTRSERWGDVRVIQGSGRTRSGSDVWTFVKRELGLLVIENIWMLSSEADGDKLRVVGRTSQDTV